MYEFKELDTRQLKAIELLASGETVRVVADSVGVNRKTVYDWLKKENFKAELDRQVKELKSNVEKKLLSNVNPFLDELTKIALYSDSDKTRLDAITYCINRLVGTPTKVQQDITGEETKENNNIDIDSVLEEIELKEVQ
ncbi:MAG: phBC6A51 family helix-turn-helix protein [Romboutsia timonensis]|uniref:phBC6A51 family helix-turn-helix protein n=1 Tax=Romboutsia timonensis TaxID=1776391 RepID=UPI002A75D03C|nr:phBC6A51 family helix-turn-helix protein [Romboutsia timonensis]MDY2882218.1 phBC6A51 family helix-turn-helix protein [Romboutsia timonensis]